MKSTLIGGWRICNKLVESTMFGSMLLHSLAASTPNDPPWQSPSQLAYLSHVLPSRIGRPVPTTSYVGVPSISSTQWSHTLTTVWAESISGGELRDHIAWVWVHVRRSWCTRPRFSFTELLLVLNFSDIPWSCKGTWYLRHRNASSTHHSVSLFHNTIQ